MKKKLLLFLLSTFIFTSCSYAYETTETNKNIGTITEEKTNEILGTEIVSEKIEEEIKLAGVGEYVENEDWKISLLYAKEYESIYDEHFPDVPEIDGNIFLVLFFEVENVSNKDDYFNMFYFESYLDGYSTDSVYLINDPENFDSLGGDVASGKKMKGYVAYEVSPEWQEIEFSYKNWAGTSGKIATFLINKEDIKN